ncbi:hypothetical protein JG540_00505 [Actinomyces weissii]|uniref:Transposase n=1 Tax=Actinomyces weissii TaxID=675090 RepID=A0A7T7MBJ4_9ACTO|nr:hypothetical protein JG540_00505 [Actinomyces weissii]
MNDRLERTRRPALGFRNLANYTTRSLLETGGFRPRLHPQLENEPIKANLENRACNYKHGASVDAGKG